MAGKRRLAGLAGLLKLLETGLWFLATLDKRFLLGKGTCTGGLGIGGFLPDLCAYILSLALGRLGGGIKLAPPLNQPRALHCEMRLGVSKIHLEPGELVQHVGQIPMPPSPAPMARAASTAYA